MSELSIDNHNRIVELEEALTALTIYCNHLYEYMTEDCGGVVPKPLEVKQ